MRARREPRIRVRARARAQRVVAEPWGRTWRGAACAEGHYPEAIELYTQAIEADPLKSLIYCNRSLCHIKMETYGLAIADATTALEIDPKCVKAYYRRGSAYMGLGKYKDARTNYKKACQLKPNDKDAALRHKECDKAVKREAFEKVRGRTGRAARTAAARAAGADGGGEGAGAADGRRCVARRAREREGGEGSGRARGRPCHCEGTKHSSDFRGACRR